MSIRTYIPLRTPRIQGAPHSQTRLAAAVVGAAVAVLAVVSPSGAEPAAGQQKPSQKTAAEKTAAQQPATKEAGPSAGTAAAKPTKTVAAKPKGAQSILVLVNDEPITAYEVEQRQRMLAGGGEIQNRAQATFKSLIQRPETTERLKAILNETVKANPGKSREQILAIFEGRKKDFAQALQRQAVESAKGAVLPGLKKQALEELIEERLKLQEAKRMNAVASEEDVDRILTGIAERNKMTKDQFAQQVKASGGDIEGMRSRFRAMVSWQEVVRRRFGAQIAITERDVDRMVAASPASGEDDVELELQRITLPMGAKLDQKQIAQRLAEAEGIVAKFSGCASGTAAAAAVQGAKFENLGKRRPSTIPEPTRSLLLNARDGEMLPPAVGGTGVELWAVCSRTVIKAVDQKREEAQSELRQKEFEILARKHLKDLRQDAAIEYR